MVRQDGVVNHGEFQVAAGGSVTITAGAPGLPLQPPTVSAPVSLVTLNPSAQYTPKAGKGLVVFRNMSPYQISMVVNGVGYNLDGIPSGPRTRTPQVSPYPELRFDTTPGTLEYDYTITGGARTHGSRQVADGQLVVVEFK